MGLELRVQQLRGGGDDNPVAVAAEAKQRGPSLWCGHPIVPPSYPSAWLFERPLPLVAIATPLTLLA
jgi:hypothetical protein